MPARAEWLLNIPKILKQLAVLDVPVVDRATCEKLFGRRRRAIGLIRHFGGYQTGRTLLVDCVALIARLEEVRHCANVQDRTAAQRALGGSSG